MASWVAYYYQWITLLIKCVHGKKVSRKQAKLILDPWMTKEILDKRKIRDNLKKTYILNKCRGSDDHNNWKKQRNKVNCMIKKAKDQNSDILFFKNEFSKIFENFFTMTKFTEMT